MTAIQQLKKFLELKSIWIVILQFMDHVVTRSPNITSFFSCTTETNAFKYRM